MKKLQILSFVSLCCVPLMSSCEDSITRDEAFCTMEFRFITIKVSGEPLTDHYTIRLSNSDTIRTKHPDQIIDKTYMVLGDDYQKKLENKEETFRFVGKRASGDVQEDFVISADRCHVSKVSGKTEI